ncbi:MAG TPA: thiolase family protein [Candidatus Acidoferrales bacterium]|nr:thiolase family protein [Candidatus Acidoferrales bacterium]
MATAAGGFFINYDDIWLLDGVRTPFADYNGVLGLVSPIDLGIKAARAVFERSKISPADVDSIIAGSVAQASFDAYMLPRHIGLYSGVPVDRPAHLVQRVCGTGIEAISQAADAITLKKINLALCVGAESMSRNPVAAFTHRSGFRMGQIEFKDFLWEALLDPAPGLTMGDTAERVALEYKITREEVDRFAELSFTRALAAQKACFLSGEIVPVVSETFELEGYKPRGIEISKKIESLAADTHVRPSPYEVLAKIRPAFGGVQTGGNSSAIVDGAAAALVGSGAYAKSRGVQPLARIVAVATVAVPPEIMAIAPAPAIRKLLDGVGLSLDQIDRFEINEAFGAQVIGVERELGLDRDKLNVNGGAIAIGHPLAATGIRLSVTVSRELRRANLRYGIASACIGGGQGIALLVENPS